MEDLLPIIIGILWLVYTIYSKSKKKEAKKQQTVRSEEVKVPSILEQLFTNNEVLQPQPYESYNEVEDNQLIDEYDKVVSEPEEVPEPFLKKELTDFAQEGQSVFIPSENYKLEEVVNEENQVERQDFDLKKAIIYSEILNAPYIGYK